MKAAEDFEQVSGTGETVMLGLVLSDMRFDRRLRLACPAGGAVMGAVAVRGVPETDFGYRAVRLPPEAVDDFVRAVCGTGLADCIYRIEPRALKPVYAPVPSSTP